MLFYQEGFGFLYKQGNLSGWFCFVAAVQDMEIAVTKALEQSV